LLRCRFWGETLVFLVRYQYHFLHGRELTTFNRWTMVVVLLCRAFSLTFFPRRSAPSCTFSVCFYRTDIGWRFLWWRCGRFRLGPTAATCRWFSTTLV
jgi:hypothetical protein